MEKFRATVTQRKLKREINEDTSTTPLPASTTTATHNKVTAAESYKQVGKPLETVSSSETTTTVVHKPAAKNYNKPKFTQKAENVNSNRIVHTLDKDGSSSEESGESEQDIEYDEDAVRKLLERKIEQAPAAKVIVSEAMMRDALSEINARKSTTSINLQSCSQSVVTIFSSGGDRDQNATTATSSFASVSSAAGCSTQQTYGKFFNNNKPNFDGGGDSQEINQKHHPSLASTNVNEEVANISDSKTTFYDGEGTDSGGCPLEKILEFLQAVMTKDYKRALVLAKQVEKYEPNNELVLEYMTVLEKVVSKEEENEYGSDSDASNSSFEDAAVGEYSEELTTSSETDSVSGEESSESSTEARSPASSGEESDEEDAAAAAVKLEVVNDSEGNKNGENVSAAEEQDNENGKPSTEHQDNSHADADDDHGEEREIQCSTDEQQHQDVNAAAAVNVELMGK